MAWARLDDQFPDHPKLWRPSAWPTVEARLRRDLAPNPDGSTVTFPTSGAPRATL